MRGSLRFFGFYFFSFFIFSEKIVFFHFPVLPFFFHFHFKNCFSLFFSFFLFYNFFPSSAASFGPPLNIAFSYKNLDFKARFWVREEERRKKNAPTETSSFPQSHAQELFVIRVRGNPHSDHGTIDH